ncbi:MAG: class I tRNA ligase family protein, partial [Legionellales bacterium]|nr:class I tRNA ligase family protein [Legionellales bacterium]
QWFINLEHNSLREKSLKVVKNNKWIPNWGMNRMFSMLEGRPDWCISRQKRVWGVPMTFVIHKDTGDLHPDGVAIMLKVADLIEENGIDAWYSVQLDGLEISDANDYCKSDDTLDVWFSSGVTHECILTKDSNLGFPADLYLEGSDQHRGWFQSSLITSVILHDVAPYNAVLTHGYTVDSDGRKMSKSLGNVISPEKIIKTLGADILRLWVAATDYHKDVSISDEILKRISEAYGIIRNTLRYLLANLYDFQLLEHGIAFDELLELDKYMMYKTKSLQKVIVNYYEEYQFHNIYQKIHNFCTVDLGGFYLDIIKDRQYTCKGDSRARRSCQTVIYHIAHSMVCWIAPILSFTAEEMWGYLPGAEAESVFCKTWYDGINDIEFSDSQRDFWNVITVVRDECNKAIESARNNNIIGSALEAEVVLYCNEEMLNKLASIQEELHFIMITSKVSLQKISDLGKDTSIDGLRIDIFSSKGQKCTRCWHRRDDVGKNTEYPDICQRCIDNVYNSGEERTFA